MLARLAAELRFVALSDTRLRGILFESMIKRVEMTKKLLFSTVWGIAFWLISAVASANYVEGYYSARVARGGDPAFGDIGFTWLFVTIGIGIFAFGLGLLGVLPGTKRR